MAVDPQRMKDHCLIIIGAGGEPDEILAKRRLAAGGRLMHILTQGPQDERVSLEFVDDGNSYDYFTWHPPTKNMKVSRFATKLQGKKRTFWTKNGPDGLELEPEQHLKLSNGSDGKLRHLMLSDAKGNVLVEMSGEIVMDVDKQTARTFDVEVQNPEINAFGCFSWRYVRLALLVMVPWQVAKFSISIAFEQEAVAGKVPWFRNLLQGLNWTMSGQIICTEMWSYSLAGERASGPTHALSNIGAVVFIMACSYAQLSEFMLCVAGVSGGTLGPLLQYYSSMDAYPERRLLPHLLWTIGQACGTVGCFIIFGLIGFAYASLLASGWAATASVFLPFATAFGETGMVVFTRLIYSKLVHKKKVNGQGPLAGDQIYLAAPCLIMSAHAFAEACRLVATFSGAIISGGFTWVPTAILGVAMNISARLGWSRFGIIKLVTRFCGGPTAMAYVAPTAWSKFHDELKIYAGYFRFAFVIALCVARAVAYGFPDLGSPLAPTFNLSATVLICCSMVAELIEDEIVTNELLPVNPAGPGLLKLNAKGDNADPAQLITLEHLPDVSTEDPWKMNELGSAGRRTKQTATVRRASSVSSGLSSASAGLSGAKKGETSSPQMPAIFSEAPTEPRKTVSLGISEDYVWARLRRWFGQPRSFNSSPALHGLRELPFIIHFSFISIVCDFTAGLLALLLGAGYMRGICQEPLEGFDRVLGLMWWDLPLPC